MPPWDASLLIIFAPFRRSEDGRPVAASTSRHPRPPRNSPTIPARPRPPEVSSFSANRSFGKWDTPAAWARGLLNGPGLGVGQGLLRPPCPGTGAPASEAAGFRRLRVLPAVRIGSPW